MDESYSSNRSSKNEENKSQEKEIGKPENKVVRNRKNIKTVINETKLKNKEKKNIK